MSPTGTCHPDRPAARPLHTLRLRTARSSAYPVRTTLPPHCVPLSQAASAELKHGRSSDSHFPAAPAPRGSAPHPPCPRRGPSPCCAVGHTGRHCFACSFRLSWGRISPGVVSPVFKRTVQGGKGLDTARPSPLSTSRRFAPSQTETLCPSSNDPLPHSPWHPPSCLLSP